MHTKKDIDKLAADFEECWNIENETGSNEELLLF